MRTLRNQRKVIVLSKKNQSGTQDGKTNHPGLPRSGELPRIGNFSAKTNKSPR